MSSRPQPDPVTRQEPLSAFPSDLWDLFLEFLINNHTGRVTVHTENGRVRMVEATVFSRTREHRQPPA